MTGLRNVVVTNRMVNLGDTVSSLAGYQVAATVFTPTDLIRPIMFCCLSGGGMSRGYWDLCSPEDSSYSFARWMAGRGYPTITVDHLGVGGSVLPDGAPAPLVSQVIAANDAAFRTLSDELRSKGSGADSNPDLWIVGVGHSMGAALTVRQQDAHRTYDAIALIGFCTKGVPQYLPAELLAACAGGIPDDTTIAELALRTFGASYVRLSGAGATDATFRKERIPESVRRAIDAAGADNFSGGALLSMLPGNVVAQLTRLTVPVLVLNGERDSLINARSGDPVECAAGSSFASEVIAGAGHNHNFSMVRRIFWERLRQWAEYVASAT